MLNNLLEMADKMLIGGAMALTFLRASGIDIDGAEQSPEAVQAAGTYERRQHLTASVYFCHQIWYLHLV